MADKLDTVSDAVRSPADNTAASLNPKLRRREMAAQMASRQAAQAPGAISGAGGYVYKPLSDGSITILHDPRGRASGLNLKSGDDAYNAIKAELESKGVSFSAPAVAPTASEAENPNAIDPSRGFGTKGPGLNAQDMRVRDRYKQDLNTIDRMTGEEPFFDGVDPERVPEKTPATQFPLRGIRQDMGDAIARASSAGEGFVPPTAENDRIAEAAPEDVALNFTDDEPQHTGAFTGDSTTSTKTVMNDAEAALALPPGSPQREAALEAALREMVA